MRKIKRIISLCLVSCLLLAMTTACSNKEKETKATNERTTENSAENSELEVLPLKTGILASNSFTEEEYEKVIGDHIAEHHKGKFEFTLKYYDNMPSMLMALQAKDIYVMILANSVAEYIVAQNDTLTIEPEIQGDGLDQNTVSYQMVMNEKDTDIHKKFNDAIVELKEDGVIDKLIETNIKGHTDGSSPEEVKLPEIKNAQTVKVAVTGDIPPIDYVAADGTPAGFNMALLAEISKKANVNIEIVTVDAGARVAALTSGRADVLFWVHSNYCTEHKDFEKGADIPKGTITTEPYFTEPISFVSFKR